MKANTSLEVTNPGPGAYESNTSLDHKGAITMKSSRFLAKKALSPGPGNYQISSPKITGVRFPNSGRGELFRSVESPGPGTYDSKLQNSARSFQMRGKKIEKPSHVPGPGTYSPKFIVKKSTTKTIGTSKRTELTVVLDTPGPGSYDSLYFSKAPKWSFHGIKDESFNNFTPGPGKYNSVDLNRSVGGPSSMTKRPELFHATLSPGPGTYDSIDSKFTSLHYSVSKSNRPKIDSRVPGPGTHQPKSLTHSFSAKFGTEAKKTLVFGNDVPAPISYDPKKLENVPKYSFAKKLEKKPGNPNPGPGTHSPKTRDSLPNGKISKSSRFIKTHSEKEILAVPGPGSYEVKSEMATGNVYISKSKREFKPSAVPGPGRYNP